MRKCRPVIDRILEKIIKKDNGCWVFTGHINFFGYGMIKIGGKYGVPTHAHREVFKHFKGEIPSGLFVCHKCDNPPCCNPDHLFLGTHQDNMDDMKRKGRRKNPFGEKSYNNKFSKELVAKIKKDPRSYNTLKREYSMSKGHISMIKNNKTRTKG